MTLTIRDSIADDIYDIYDISRITWLDTYPNQQENITIEDVQSVFKNSDTQKGKARLEQRKERYKNPKIHVWVAEENNSIIGYCSAHKQEGNGRVMAIYVLPSVQGKGIGKQLISKALEWLPQDQDIFVNVARYNSQAINFYKGFRFSETGREGVFDSVATLPSGKVIPEIELKLSRK